eukprot:7643576-Ditylum_brightwellii.AAC.1
MVDELTRLINKYDSFPWDTKHIAKDLVELLEEHRTLISADLTTSRFRKMIKRTSSSPPQRFENLEK